MAVTGSAIVNPGKPLPTIQDIRMIAFDLDGTLLTEEKTLTPGTREILCRAAAEGVILLTTTGRSLVGIPDTLKVLPGASYVLTSNGAGVYRRLDTTDFSDFGWKLSSEALAGLPTFELEPKAGYELLFENLMDIRCGLELMRELGELEVMPDPFIDGCCFMRADKAYLIDQMDVRDAMKDYIRASRTSIEDMDTFLQDKQMQKITINFATGSDGHRIDFKPVLDILSRYPEFVAVTGGIRNIEVSDKKATKGDAMMTLAGRLGIRADQIIAFGDSENDITMLKAAGIGVAMANSLDITIESADAVTLSNDEEGVAEFLKQLF